MRWAFALLVAGCLKSSPPVVDHHVQFTHSGLSSSGPASYRADADLDNRVLEISVPGDEIPREHSMPSRGPDKVSKKTLSQADVDEIRRLAIAARHEEPGPEGGVSDSLEELVFDGDPPKRIANSRMTAPVAKQLAQRLRALAGW